MTTAITNTNSGHVLAQAVEDWGQERIRVLKNTLCSELNNGQLALFLEVCSRKRLDPFARQIYAVTRRAKERGEWVTKMTIQTGIDGFRTVAQRSGVYRGQVGPEWCGDDGKWVDVWLAKEAPRAARVGVIRADFSQPLYAVALFDEYAQTKRDGGLNSMWSKFPTVMLAKCAEALALRKAFPEELSGLYTSDEMGDEQQTADLIEATATDVTEARTEDEPKALPERQRVDEGTVSAILAEADRLGTDDDALLAAVRSYGDGVESIEEMSQADAEAMLNRMRAKHEPVDEREARDQMADISEPDGGEDVTDAEWADTEAMADDADAEDLRDDTTANLVDDLVQAWPMKNGKPAGGRLLAKLRACVTVDDVKDVCLQLPDDHPFKDTARGIFTAHTKRR